MKLLATLALALFVSSCTSEDQWRKTPIGLGNRIRITVEGRDIPSILTEDHFLYFVVDGPNGESVPVKSLAIQTTGTDGLSLILATAISAANKSVQCSMQESLAVDEIPTEHSEDVVLPKGWHLSLRLGDTYIYRVEGGQMITDDNVELTLWATDESNRRYLPASRTASEPRGRAAAPENWPVAR